MDTSVFLAEDETSNQCFSLEVDESDKYLLVV